MLTTELSLQVESVFPGPNKAQFGSKHLWLPLERVRTYARVCCGPGQLPHHSNIFPCVGPPYIELIQHQQRCFKTFCDESHAANGTTILMWLAVVVPGSRRPRRESNDLKLVAVLSMVPMGACNYTGCHASILCFGTNYCPTYLMYHSHTRCWVKQACTHKPE